jgi:hypothetical protein
MKLSLVRVLPLAVALLVPFAPSSAFAEETGGHDGAASKPHAAHATHAKRAKAAKPHKAAKPKAPKAPKASKKAPRASKKAAK